MSRSKEPAPPDPGIKPGGIRDRAMRAVLARRLTTIKETVLPEQRSVITSKINRAHALRQYLTEVLEHDSGAAFAIVSSFDFFASHAAALQKHNNMVKRYMKPARC